MVSMHVHDELDYVGTDDVDDLVEHFCVQLVLLSDHETWHLLKWDVGALLDRSFSLENYVFLSLNVIEDSVR